MTAIGEGGPWLVTVSGERRSKAVAELALIGTLGETCNHGFALIDCAICHKVKGECNFGSCTKPARSSPTVLGRRTCRRHFDLAQSIDRSALRIHHERAAAFNAAEEGR